jgi:DNA-binding NarL/FixJ family response regulator
VTRFLIVDDHPLFREALQSAVLLVHPDADILEATSIEGALDMIAAHRDFDLALLDLSLPGTSGFGGLIAIRSAYPKLPVLVVSGHEEPALVREAISLGIAGYVPKSTSKKELALAIAEVLGGSIYVPAKYAAAAGEISGESDVHQILSRLNDLTPQQMAVLEMIRAGYQNKRIAYELKLAESTVKAHVSEILRKLHVFTRTKAVIEVAKVDFEALRKGAAALKPGNAPSTSATRPA